MENFEIKNEEILLENEHEQHNPLLDLSAEELLNLSDQEVNRIPADDLSEIMSKIMNSGLHLDRGGKDGRGTGGFDDRWDKYYKLAGKAFGSLLNKKYEQSN